MSEDNTALKGLCDMSFFLDYIFLFQKSLGFVGIYDYDFLNTLWNMESF